MSRTTVRSLEVLILLSFICRDHSAPPLLGSKHGMGSLGFRWSYADNFGVLARGANCTNVHLARLIAGVKKAGLDFHDISLASGSADVLGYEVYPANAYCSGADKRLARIRSVATDGLFAPSHQRPSDGARQWSRVLLALSNRGALSILDASFKFARASYLVSGEPWSTVRMEQEHSAEDSVSLPQ